MRRKVAGPAIMSANCHWEPRSARHGACLADGLMPNSSSSHRTISLPPSSESECLSSWFRFFRMRHIWRLRVTEYLFIEGVFIDSGLSWSEEFPPIVYNIRDAEGRLSPGASLILTPVTPSSPLERRRGLPSNEPRAAQSSHSNW